MKKLLLLLFVCLAPGFTLPAQTTDPELAEKLRSVMLLFDKNQQALKEEIVALSESNKALTEANLKLFQDLQSTEQRLQALEEENLLLRSKISEVAVRELESASLSNDLVATTSPPPAPTQPRAVAATPSPEPAQPPPQNTPTVNADLININTASLEELATLPTIDEAMAEQIISNRPYDTVEDLIINQGFGPMKLRRINPYITAE